MESRKKGRTNLLLIKPNKNLFLNIILGQQVFVLTQYGSLVNMCVAFSMMFGYTPVCTSILLDMA